VRVFEIYLRTTQDQPILNVHYFVAPCALETPHISNHKAQKLDVGL